MFKILLALLFVAPFGLFAQEYGIQQFKKDWERLNQLHSPNDYAAVRLLDSLEKTVSQPYKGICNFLISQQLCSLGKNKRDRQTPTQKTWDLQKVDEWSTDALYIGAYYRGDSAFRQLSEYGWVPASDFAFLSIPGNVAHLSEMSLYDLVLMSYLQTVEPPLYQFAGMSVDSVWMNLAMERHAALHHRDILIEYELCKLMSSYSDVYRGPEKSKAWAELLVLEEKYGPASAIQYQKGICLYKFVQERYSAEDSVRNRWILDCKRCFEQVLAAATDSFYLVNAESMLQWIRRKELRIADIPAKLPPTPKILLPIAYRNMDTLYVSVYSKGPYDISFYLKGLDKIVQNRELVRRQQFRLPNPVQHGYFSTDVWLDSLPLGNYVLIFHYKPEIDTFTILNSCEITVTRIYMQEVCGEKRSTYTFMDNRTGVPLPGLKVTVDNLLFDKHRRTDRNGRITLKNNEDDMFLSIEESPESEVKWLVYAHNVYPRESRDERMYDEKDPPRNYFHYRAGEVPNSKVILDRKMYRPGQTLYFKAFLVEGKRVLANRRVVVELRKGRTVIDKIEAKSNRYGTVSGSIKLPENQYGSFDLFVCEKYSVRGFSTNTFEIAAYKLPTFKVEFEDILEPLAIGDTVPLCGRALSFTGEPIRDAQVVLSYKNTHDRSEGVSVRYLQTDATGRFRLDIPTKPKPTGYVELGVTADVTDLSGEMTSAVKRIWLRDKPFTIYAHSADIDLATSDSLYVHKEMNCSSCDDYQGFMVQTEIWRVDVSQEYKPLIYPDYQKPSNPIYTEEEYHRFFPDYVFEKKKPGEWPVLEKVYSGEEVYSGKQSSRFCAKGWKPGLYRIQFVAKDGQGRTDTTQSIFRAYDTQGNQSLPETPLYLVLDSRSKRSVSITVGSSMRNAAVYCDVYQHSRLKTTRIIHLDNEQKTITQPIRKEPSVKVLCYTVQRNHLESASMQLRITDNIRTHFEPGKLAMNLTRWNSPLRPGMETHWEMEVRNLATGKSEPTEVLFWMIDSSLIVLDQNRYSWRWKKHYFDDWLVPYEGYFRTLKPNNVWFNYFSDYAHAYDFSSFEGSFKLPLHKQFPMFSMGHLVVPLVEYSPGYTFLFSPDHTSSARLSGENVRTTPGRSVTLTYQSRTGEMDVLTPDASEMVDLPERGSLLEEKGNPMFRIRNRFEETAVFYPQLYTDKEGKVAFDFTVPDQLTTWKFYAIAFTRRQHAGRLEGAVVSKLPFMLQTNAPRFLREGDTITLRAKITNRSETDLDGAVTVEFFNGEDGEPVEMVVLSGDRDAKFHGFTIGIENISVSAGATQMVQFPIVVPKNVTAIGYRMTARFGNYGDGEENILPVLPNRMLVTEAQHFFVPAHTDTAFTFHRYLNTQSPTLRLLNYTMEMTANPAWLAIQSMPSLMRYPYECNEQLFSKLFAAAVMRHTLQQNPALADVFERWRSDTLNSSLESLMQRNGLLHNILLEETPWLNDTQNESLQRKENAELFSADNLDRQLTQNLNKLMRNQLQDGGWGWYGHYNYSRFITDYLIAGFYKLQRLGVELSADAERMLAKAVRQSDKAQEKRYEDYVEELKKNPDTKFNFNEEDVHYLYARSFAGFDSVWLKKPYVQNLINLSAHQIYSAPYMRQAEFALAMHHLGETEVANHIVENLRYYAFQDKELGMYWGESPDNRRKDWRIGAYYSWYEAPVERQAMIIEAFAEISPREEELTAMKQWLLTQKEGNSWKSTKASSAAVYALLLNAPKELLEPAATTITVGGETFTPVQDERAEAGTGYLMHVWDSEETTPQLADVAVHTDSVHPAFGACYWQYLEVPEQVTSFGDGLTISRTLLHRPGEGNGSYAEPVTAENPMRLGERITVRLVIRSDRELEYVHVKDPRTAAFEPVDVHERRGGNNGAWWVESPRDAAEHFFLDRLPQGTVIIEYDLFVTQTGAFSHAPATVECMYAPGHRGQSGGERVTVQ